MALTLPLRRFRRSEHGTILVEFALSLPLLILLFAVIIEGGRMMWSYQTAISGVRDAARHVGRIVSTDVCPNRLPAAGSYDNMAATIVRDSIHGTSVLPAQVQLDPATSQPVTATFSCVTGAYRLPSTPRVTVAARVRINFPFEGLFNLAGGGLAPFIVTTITNQSRVFGS